jgi:hypothetical protein
VRGLQPKRCVCLVIGLAVAAAMVGCRRGNQPVGPASTTTPPASTTTAPEPATTPTALPTTPPTPTVTPPTLPPTPVTPTVTPPTAPSTPVAPTITPPTVPSTPPTPTAPTAAQPGTLGSQTGGVKLVPIKIELPAPAFRGTPVPRNEPNVEEPSNKPRAPFLAPEGTVNLARGKPVTCSDPAPASGEIDFVTDGDKEASDFGYLELRPGTQWVQIDLGQKAAIYAVLLWHNHAEARVYRDVVVQISDDPDFLQAQTVFNNDYDDSSGLGIGSNMGYVETSEGKLIDCRGIEGRYVRLYSKGNNLDDKNNYTEVEVFGLVPARG